jgi:hypothetical protein
MTRGGISAWGLGVGLTTPHGKKTKLVTKSIQILWINDLNKGIWALASECGTKRDEVMGGWRKLHNEELDDLYSSPSVIRIIKSRRMRWAGHVA